jgi:hypothetical protein
MGLSKDRPSIVQAAESVSRASSAERLRPASSALRDGKAIPIRDPSSWFLATSTVCSSTTLRPFSGRCRSWGSPRFVPLRHGLLAMRLLPFEAFPPPTATQVRRRISVSAWARVTGSRSLPIAPFTANLASSSLLSSRSPAVSRCVPRWKRDLEALLHRRVRCSDGHFRPFVPGAPLGLSDPSCRRPVRLLLTASGEEARGRPRAGLSALRQRPLREVAPRSRLPIDGIHCMQINCIVLLIHSIY